MSKKILVLKNQGNLELESHDWMELHIYNYQRITIDKKNTYLLKEPDKNSFYSLDDQILDIDGAILFILNSPPDVISEILNILKSKGIPYVILMEESSKEISQSENEVFAIDNHIESLVLALNKLSSLIDNNIDKQLKFPIKVNEKDKKNSEPSPSKKELLEEYATKKTENHTENLVQEISQVFEKVTLEDELNPINKNITSMDLKPEDSLNNENKETEKLERLKKIKFYLHPIMMNEVKCSLERLGFSNITITNIKYLDAEKKNETYRGSHYHNSLSPKLEAWLVVRESEVPYIMDTLSQLKNEDINENALISDVEEVIRISSLEKGNYAID